MYPYINNILCLFPIPYFINKMRDVFHARINRLRFFSIFTVVFIIGKNFTPENAHTIYVGEKPYKCDDCSKSFRQNSSLSGHKSAMHLGHFF